MATTVDTRYPYTYACDYLREISDVQISRSNASRIRMKIAEAAGIPDDLLAAKLADIYLAKKANEEKEYQSEVTL
jgi:hypothetical protein